jgi:hypothetical protein
MWPWRAKAEITEEGVSVGGATFAFADLTDASLRGSTLCLVTPSGRTWRGRVRGGMAVLDKVLDGIDAAHPAGGTVYRTAAFVEPKQDEAPHARRHRKRPAQAASSDLWIGRTLYK